MTPPQPNSISSGCAPNARRRGGLSLTCRDCRIACCRGSALGVTRPVLVQEFRLSVIGAVDKIAIHKDYFRSIGVVEVSLLGGTSDVAGAAKDGLRPARSRVAEDDLRFARVMVAVVEEEDDFAADCAFQAPRRDDLCIEKPSREQAARLLTETSDRISHSERPGIA